MRLVHFKSNALFYWVYWDLYKGLNIKNFVGSGTDGLEKRPFLKNSLICYFLTLAANLFPEKIGKKVGRSNSSFKLFNSLVYPINTFYPAF